MIKEILANVAFVLFIVGIFGATAFIEPMNEIIIEAKGE